MPARLHALGGLHVVDDVGRRQELPPDRPTALLLVLALRGDWVRRAELAALFRPDAAEDEGLAYLRKLVFRARRLPGAGDLEAEPTRLRWRVASDVADFRAALATGDAAAALARWRGSLLAGVEVTAPDAVRSWLEVERADLDRAWRAAVLRHADARLAAGAPEDALAVVEPLRRADPLDEEALQVELRAHLAAGRPRSAGSAFEDFRALLAAELGVAPLPGTLALAESIRAPAADVAGAPPVDGALVGRGAELDRLDRWWADGARWVTLAGLGGAGKTRLALEAARRFAADGGRAVVVAAAGLGGVDDVATVAAALLGVHVGGREPARVALARHLGGGPPVLLLLDDLAAVTAVEVAAWSEAVAGVRVLATARAPFELPGEWLVDVGGLAVPPPAADPAGYDAVRLFVARAERRAAVPFDDPAGMAAVGELCRRVDGLPLALELAAAWSRVAPVEALLARLAPGADALAVDLAGVAPHHLDLYRVVGASLDLLAAGERTTLARLAAFGADFGAAAAARVAEADLARLLRLVNLGLVARAAGGRYRVHPLVAEVARAERAPDQRAADAAAVRRDAATLLTAAAHDLTRRDEDGALRALAPELEALRAAWRDAVAAADAGALVGMGEGLHRVWEARGAYHEAAVACDAALAAVGPAAPEARPLRAWAGFFAMRLGRAERATALLEAVDLAPPDGVAAFALRVLGALDLLAGRRDAARARLEAAHARFEALGDPDGAARAASNLSILAHHAGDLDAAEAWAARALAAARAHGSRRGEGDARSQMGVVLEARGALGEAEAAYLAARDAYAAAGDPRGEASAWTNLGHLAERRDDPVAAEDAYRRGLAVKRTLGDPVATAITLVNLADVLRVRGDAGAARHHLLEALALAEGAGADYLVARALWAAARERAAAGASVEAAALASALTRFAAAEAWLRAAAAEAAARWGGASPGRPGGSDRDAVASDAAASDAAAGDDAVRRAVARLRRAYAAA